MTQTNNRPIKKVRTIKDIKNDPRIKCLTSGYDEGQSMVEAHDGYLFWGETGSEIGTIKQLCYEINNWLEEVEF